MSGTIPPISPAPYQPPEDQGAAEQLWKFVNECRALMQEWTENPSTQNTQKAKNFMQEMKSYLLSHQQQILLIGKKIEPQIVEELFQGTLQSTNNFLQNPTEESFHEIHSELTQMHWLLAHPT